MFPNLFAKQERVWWPKRRFFKAMHLNQSKVSTFEIVFEKCPFTPAFYPFWIVFEESISVDGVLMLDFQLRHIKASFVA